MGRKRCQRFCLILLISSSTHDIQGFSQYGQVLLLGGMLIGARAIPRNQVLVADSATGLFVAITGTVAVLIWLVRRPRSDDGHVKSPAGYLLHAMLLAIIVLFGMWLQALALLLVVIGSGGIPPGPARWCSSDWEKHWCTRHSSLRYRTLRTRRGVHPRSPCIACGVMVATALAAC